MAKKKTKAKKKKEIKHPLLINVLHEALVKAGHVVERDGWKENEHSVPPNDECEWLDVQMLDEEGNQITVHIYFKNKSTVLSEVTLYKAKKKTGFGTPNTFAMKQWPIKK